MVHHSCITKCSSCINLKIYIYIYIYIMNTPPSSRPITHDHDHPPSTQPSSTRADEPIHPMMGPTPNRVSIIDALNELKARPYEGELTYDFDTDYSNLVWDENMSLGAIPTKEQLREKLTELELNIPLYRLKQLRNIKLQQTDVYSLPDYPYPNETTKQEWLTYRQQLRDLPANSSPQLQDNGKVTNVTWPTPPS